MTTTEPALESPALESSVPPHLRRPSFSPKHRPGTFTPPYPGFSARFGEDVQTLVMAYFGVQVADVDDPRLPAALDEIRDSFGESGGPGFWDRARYVDGAGYTTIISFGYWDNLADFDRWYPANGVNWTAAERFSPGIGFFLELVTPSIERVETIFSTNDAAPGVAGLSGQFSGMVEEHSYWGSARDRFAVAQDDPLYADGEISVSADGPVTTVVLHQNACLIRSGQDISIAGDEERDFYLTEVEPVLREGMDFLRDDGEAIGCYDNRYMTILDENNQDTFQTFGMSWWRDLALLEDWSASHPTHLKIFGSSGRHLAKFGADTKLRLYHEITVPDAQEQRFVYVGCHPRTGLLRAI